MSAAHKFLLVVRQASDQTRPQQKSLNLGDQPWILEWSTASDISMTVDYFNLTIGRVRSEKEQKRIDEVWRVTHIPGHERKIVYGENIADTTSTQSRDLQDGVYVVKLTGITSIAEGLRIQSGVGVAIFNISVNSAVSSPSEDSEPTSTDTQVDNNKLSRISNSTLSNLFDLSEEHP